MSARTYPLGTTGYQVGRLGYGLMNFTWKPKQTPDEQAFEAIKLAIDSGSNMLNSGEFYGAPEPTLGLQLLGRFFTQYPEYADRCYLSVKGGLQNMQPIATEENLRKSVTNINSLLGGKKKMDLFEMARVDRNVPIEEAMKILDKLRNEGHFKDIGLSEVSAATIRKAASVTKIGAVEVEYSPWSLDVEHNGVLAACKELNIPLVAYSPLGRGFLTGTLRSPDDIPEGDNRRMFDRFKPENFDKNLKLVDEIQAFAKEKGVTSTQLGLAWLLAQWEGILPIPGSTRPAGVKEAVEAYNVTLSEADVKRLRDIISSADIVGGRYNDHAKGLLEG